MSNALFEENLALWKRLLPAADKFLLRKDFTFPAPVSSPADLQKIHADLSNSHHQCLMIYGFDRTLYEDLIPWLESNPQHFLIFLEDNPGILCSFLSSDHARKFLLKTQTLLIYGNIDNEMGYFIHLISLSKSDLNLHFITLPHKDKEKASGLQAFARFIWLRSQEHEKEYKGASKAFANNFYHNLYLLSESKDYSNFVNKFKGIPAIIAGAGPSLSLNRHLLKDLKDKALIIGGGTSINALNSGNIQPHLGVGIDPNPSFYNRILSSTAWEVPFIYYYRMFHQAISLVHGEKIFMNFTPGFTIPDWFHKQLGIHFDITTDKEMLNVINVATFIALQLGCNPIIFVGIDLAYTGDASYAQGLQGVATQLSSTSFTTKTADEEIIIRHDIYGKPIKTLWKWTLESLWYSKLKTEYPETTFVNCTEGGLGFHGIPNQPLVETAQKYCQTTYSFDEQIQELLATTQRCSGSAPEDYTKLLLEFDTSLQNCRQVVQNLLENLEKDTWEALKLQGLDLISQEPAYKHLIQTYDDYLQLQLQLPFLRLDALRDQISEESYSIEKISMQKKRLQQILSLIDSNRKMIGQAIKAPHLPLCTSANGNNERRIYEGTTLKTFYPDNTPKSVIPYQNGLLDGEVLLYYSNGSLSRKLHYFTGLKHGTEEVWNRGGQLILQAEYSQGIPINIAREWHFNGVLSRECHYNDKGEAATLQSWDKNGKPIHRLDDKEKARQTQFLPQIELLENALKGIILQLRHIPNLQQEFGKKIQFYLQRTLRIRNALSLTPTRSKDTGETFEKASMNPQEIENEIQQISQDISELIIQMQNQMSQNTL